MAQVNRTSGRVYRSRALFCTMSGSFDLRNFPIDSQQLELTVQSFSLSSDRLVLSWHDGKPLDPPPETAIVNSLWLIDDSSTRIEERQFRRDQVFSAAIATIDITRRTTQYVIKIIVPLALLVLLSSFQFWIDRASTPARVGFALTMTLTVYVLFFVDCVGILFLNDVCSITFNIILSQELPRVGYSSLLDQYVLIALFVNAFAVIEYVLLSASTSAWAAESRFALQWKAGGIALETFSRCALAPFWIIVSVLFFLPRPGSLIALVVLCVIVFAVAVVVASKSYAKQLRLLRELKRRQEETAAKQLATKELEEQQAKTTTQNDSVRRRVKKRQKL